MTSPIVRSAGSVVGWESRMRAYDPKQIDEGISASSAASRATSVNRSWATKALAPESDRM